MALIICPECGGKISDQADKCIHCGYPLKKINEISLKCDKENNMYVYKNNLYNLTELVNYLKNNTFAEYEMDLPTWKEARSILKRICPVISEGDRLINYIKMNRSIPDKELKNTTNNIHYAQPTLPIKSHVRNAVPFQSQQRREASTSCGDSWDLNGLHTMYARSVDTGGR